MKEHFIANLKKIIVMFIAGLMVLGLVPVGLIALNNPSHNAEGEFFRLFPVMETYVSAKENETDISVTSQTPDTFLAGDYYDSYIRFDLNAFKKLDHNDITNAKLRLTPVERGINKQLPITLSIMENNSWDSNITYNTKPSGIHDIVVSDFNVTASQCQETPIEVDLTEYVKEYIKDNREQISFCLDGGNSGLTAFAGTKYPDKAFRPCLKITTGTATDPDFPDLKKATYDGATSNNPRLTIDSSNQAELKFNLNPYNIQGAMHSVLLKLSAIDIQKKSSLNVYCNDILAYSSSEPNISNMQNIDITDTVNDLYARGTTSLTLKITGGDTGRIIFSNSGDTHPKLLIKATDDPNVSAVIEGLTYALEQNPSSNEISSNLSEIYTTENGTEAFFKWFATYPTGEPANNLLKENGEVILPEWFENSKAIVADVTVASGAYSRTRQYNLTLLPQQLPDYQENKFTNYVKFGTAKSEEKHKVAYTPDNIRQSADNLTYRIVSTDDIVAFNIKTNPTKQNYLTLKLTAENVENTQLVIENLMNREADAIRIEPDNKFSDDGFVYCTYPLPADYPVDKGYSSFRIFCDTDRLIGNIIPHWNIYGAYITESPYFDPQEFSDRGESLKEKASARTISFYRAIKDLFKRVLPNYAIEPDGSLTADETAVTPQIWTENVHNSIAFTDGENTVAVVLSDHNQPIRVHRSTLYYDSYAELYPDRYHDNSVIAIDYGLYQIFINNTNQSHNIPWEEENLKGMYRNLVTDNYYAFLGDGMAADDSVLPEGATLTDGNNFTLNGNETAILAHLAEPIYYPDWRVSEINKKSISQTKINKKMIIDEITIKNVGTASETAEELNIICGVYQEGKVIDITCKTISVVTGSNEYPVVLDGITISPGQTFRVFIEQNNAPVGEISPKLELS